LSFHSCQPGSVPTLSAHSRLTFAENQQKYTMTSTTTITSSYNYTISNTTNGPVALAHPNGIRRLRARYDGSPLSPVSVLLPRVRFHPTFLETVRWIKAASQMTVAEKQANCYLLAPEDRPSSPPPPAPKKAARQPSESCDMPPTKLFGPSFVAMPTTEEPVPMDWEPIPEPASFPPPPPAPKKARQPSESCGLSSTRLFESDGSSLRLVTTPLTKNAHPISVPDGPSTAPPALAAQNDYYYDYYYFTSMLFYYYYYIFFFCWCYDGRSEVSEVSISQTSSVHRVVHPCDPSRLGSPQEVPPNRPPPEPPPFSNQNGTTTDVVLRSYESIFKWYYYGRCSSFLGIHCIPSLLGTPRVVHPLRPPPEPPPFPNLIQWYVRFADTCS
jgi:hypothetical protein